MKNFFLLALMFSALLFAEDYDFIVAQDGSGDYLTVQEAVDAVPHLRKNRTVILLKAGTYKEKLIVPSTKTNITFEGEGADRTIITYDDYASKKNRFGEEIGTSGSSSVYIYGDGFEANGITFENSAGDVGQAVAMRVDGDRVRFENCRFLGNQDTLYPHGKQSRQYYKNCYIEGTVDFIFGWSTAWFEGCEIYCKGDGYITAASTEQNSTYGFVFNNCRIYGSAEKGSVFLGRPWRPYAKTVFMNCNLSEVVHPEGWDPWRSEEKKKTAYYAEFNNNGPGWQPEHRAHWAHQLNDGSSYTINNVFGDWNPE